MVYSETKIVIGGLAHVPVIIFIANLIKGKFQFKEEDIKEKSEVKEVRVEDVKEKSEVKEEVRAEDIKEKSEVKEEVRAEDIKEKSEVKEEAEKEGES